MSGSKGFDKTSKVPKFSLPIFSRSKRCSPQPPGALMQRLFLLVPHTTANSQRPHPKKKASLVSTRRRKKKGPTPKSLCTSIRTIVGGVFEENPLRTSPTTNGSLRFVAAPSKPGATRADGRCELRHDPLLFCEDLRPKIGRSQTKAKKGSRWRICYSGSRSIHRVHVASIRDPSLRRVNGRERTGRKQGERHSEVGLS